MRIGGVGRKHKGETNININQVNSMVMAIFYMDMNLKWYIEMGISLFQYSKRGLMPPYLFSTNH